MTGNGVTDIPLMLESSDFADREDGLEEHPLHGSGVLARLGGHVRDVDPYDLGIGLEELQEGGLQGRAAAPLGSSLHDTVGLRLGPSVLNFHKVASTLSPEAIASARVLVKDALARQTKRRRKRPNSNKPKS